MDIKDYAGVIAAIIVVIGTLVNVFVTPKLARGNERAKWMREQRHTNYARFISAVQAHVLQDLRRRDETTMLQAFQTLPDMPAASKAVLKTIEMQTTVAAYPAAMESINEVFLAANGARLVASTTIEPLIEPLVNMLLGEARDGFASKEEEAEYRNAIDTFIRKARTEIAADARLGK